MFEFVDAPSRKRVPGPLFEAERKALRKSKPGKVLVLERVRVVNDYAETTRRLQNACARYRYHFPMALGFRVRQHKDAYCGTAGYVYVEYDSTLDVSNY